MLLGPTALILSLRPSQKLPERRPAMAVLCLFFRTQLSKRFLNLRKKEKRIVTEAIRSARRIQDRSFRLAAKHFQRLSILRRGDHAYEPSCSLLRPNPPQLPQQSRIVGLVVAVDPCQMRRLCGVAR